MIQLTLTVTLLCIVVCISRNSSKTHSMCSSRRSIPLIKDLTTKALVNLGHSEIHSQIITDVLMYAELRGNNQGIIKLITGVVVMNLTNLN